MIPINETEARWIRVLRVNLLLEWSDVSELFTKATGRTINGGGVDGGRCLCRWAAELLGEDADDAPWNGDDMGKDSSISWTHHTFNPWWGCQRVSPGCERCYAESFAKRVGHGDRLPVIWGPEKTSARKFFGERHWDEPLKWNRAAETTGERHRVFCASMADVFEDRADLVDERAKLWLLIEETPHLDWLLLTKRPENISKLSPWRALVAEGRYDDRPPWPSNVWIGTTVEDQARAEERLPWLLEVPAAVRFISCEPLLEPIDLENVTPYYIRRGMTGSSYEPIVLIDALRGHVKGPDDMLDFKVDWVIVGGESGGHARPFGIEWARQIVRATRGASPPCS